MKPDIDRQTSLQMERAVQKTKQEKRLPGPSRPGRARTPAAAAAAPRKRAPRAAVPAGSILLRIKFMGDLPTVVGRRTIELPMPAENTVADLLAALSKRYGEAFTSRVFQAPGKLHHYILLFVDGKKVPGNSAGWSQTLGDGEIDVVMLPMFGGG